MGVGGALEKAQAAAAIARVLSPAEMVQRLGQVDSIPELAEISKQAAGAAINALLTRCIAAGRAQELAGIAEHEDEKTLAELAEMFGLSKRTLQRYAQIYREIIRPRCERDGAHAQFWLEEQSWYLVATQAAPVVERPAIELIEEAEEKKAADAKFSAAKWKRELGLSSDDEGSTTSADKKIDRALGKLASFEDDEIDEYVKYVDIHKKLERIEDAYSRADRILQGVRQRLQEEGKR